MARELIKVGLVVVVVGGLWGGDSPYSSHQKVVQREEQGEPLAVVWQVPYQQQQTCKHTQTSM